MEKWVLRMYTAARLCLLLFGISSSPDLGDCESLNDVFSTRIQRPTTEYVIPSGKRTKNYGKSPFLMGKSTIFYGHF